MNNLFTSDKIPYLLGLLLSGIGLLLTFLYNQLNDQNTIEYSLEETEFHIEDEIRYSNFECLIKNISDNPIDTAFINFQLKPDTVTLIDRFLSHKLEPVPPASLHGYNERLIRRMTVITFENMQPGFTYNYKFSTQTSIPDNYPTVHYTAALVPFILQEKNFGTWLLRNQIGISVILLLILIVASSIYIKKLLSQET